MSLKSLVKMLDRQSNVVEHGRQCAMSTMLRHIFNDFIKNYFKRNLSFSQIIFLKSFNSVLYRYFINSKARQQNGYKDTHAKHNPTETKKTQMGVIVSGFAFQEN